MRPVRVAFTGSVDDGKSTLLGRLMHDAERLFADEVAAVQRSSGTELNLAWFTDGLMIERERGITLDVAWRHLTLRDRRFLIADVPGHAELVRNMATGASVADAAVVLVDATRGPQPQTMRHLQILRGLGVTDIAVCLNKIDLVKELPRLDWAEGLQIISVSALTGANVVHHVSGPTLADHLLSLTPFEPSGTRAIAQLPPREGWHACHLIGEAPKVGDRLTAWPEGREVEVREVHEGSLRLSIELPRGTLLTAVEPLVTTGLDLVVTWLEKPRHDVTVLQHGRRTRATFSAFGGGEVERLGCQLASPTWFEAWNVCHDTSCALIIDDDGRTIGAARYDP